MGHSVSKFRSLPLTSYAANPLAIVDPAYCATCNNPYDEAQAITKLHVRQSGAVSLMPSPDATITVTDDHGAVVFHIDGSPHLLLPLQHHHNQHYHPQSDDGPAPPITARLSELHMTNVYGEEILNIHAEPSSGPPSPTSDSLASHTHLGHAAGDESPPLDHLHSLAASGRSSSRSSIASFSHHAPTHKLDALATFPVFSIHRPASAVAPPSPMWDRTSMNSFDAVLLSCGDNNFLTLPPSALSPPRSSASTTTNSNSTAQTHRLAALWTHDPTLCMHVEATKLNLHSHSVTLAVSCPRNGTLFVKAATDAPVTFIFSGHPSHGGLLVARAYRMPPTASDFARSSSFTASSSPAMASAAASASASLHRHATPSPNRSTSLSRTANPRTHSPAPPTTSKQTKPPPTLSRSAELFTVDVAPGVDQAAIVALCVIAEALRAHLVATHLAAHQHGATHAGGGFLTHASMSRKPSAASDTSRRSSLRGGIEFVAHGRGPPMPSPPVPVVSGRFAGGSGSLLRPPRSLTRSNSVPFDSLAGVLNDPPGLLSTSAPPPPMMDSGPGAGGGAYVSPLVARLRAEEGGGSGSLGRGERSDQVPDLVEPPRGIGARRSSNPGPIRWAADMFRHKNKSKKSGKDKKHKKDKEDDRHPAGEAAAASNGSLDKSKSGNDLGSSQKVAKSSGSLVTAG